MAGGSLNLRPIRFVIYITTLFYGLVSLLRQPSELLEGGTIFSGVAAASVVGTVQLLATVVGVVVELSPSKHRETAIRAVLGVLVFAYMYEFVLILLLTQDPFRWAPLLVYAVVCGVLYLAEG